MLPFEELHARASPAFRSVYALITVVRDDGYAGVELFELDDLDQAWARFRGLGCVPRP